MKTAQKLWCQFGNKTNGKQRSKCAFQCPSEMKVGKE